MFAFPPHHARSKALSPAPTTSALLMPTIFASAGGTGLWARARSPELSVISPSLCVRTIPDVSLASRC